MQKLLSDNRTDVALAIGNGVNRYGATTRVNAWDKMLTTLADKHLPRGHTGIPVGVSPTEFYDVLELAITKTGVKTFLQTEFCDLMKSWTHLPHHQRIVRWAAKNSVPVLTTNFENTLGMACAAKLQRCGKDKFTAWYPWSSCYAPSPVTDPLKQFAIWHINGMQRYRQSIRLGLSHYMGSVERARSWFQRSGTRLFGATDIRAWPGANTWLQVFLHKPLVFVGLSLGENEVFLRWLLIERAHYFQKFAAREKPAWYVHTGALDPGRELFLNGVGVKPYPVSSYDDMWGAKPWE